VTAVLRGLAVTVAMAVQEAMVPPVVRLREMAAMLATAVTAAWGAPVAMVAWVAWRSEPEATAPLA
jgi:hypothetical protein